MEQTDDEPEESEDTDKLEGRPVSIAVHAGSKQDGSGEKEFHLQVEKEPLNEGGQDDELVQSTTAVKVSADSSQAKV